MSRGGKREGAGAKRKDPRLVKIPVGYRLSRWLVECLREQLNQAATIEDALIWRHKLKSSVRPEVNNQNAGVVKLVDARDLKSLVI